MATYEYRCQDHGDFDSSKPMGTAPKAVPCPTCRRPAGRRYTAPLLRQSSEATRTLLGMEERSRHEPEVVNSVPPRRPSTRANSDATARKGPRLPRG